MLPTCAAYDSWPVPVMRGPVDDAEAPSRPGGGKIGDLPEQMETIETPEQPRPDLADFCPYCDGDLEGGCPLKDFHKGHYWVSLGPTDVACPDCRELLVDGKCAHCGYTPCTADEARLKHQLRQQMAELEKEIKSPGTTALNLAAAPVVFPLAYFVLTSLMAAVGIPPKAYRGNWGVIDRLQTHWELWGWLVKLAAIALVPLGLIALYRHLAGLYVSPDNEQVMSRLHTLRARLEALPRLPIRLYATPLSAERVGSQGKLQEANVLRFSPRSQTDAYSEPPS